MNIGIIGCGNISRIYLENLHQRFPGVTVRAVADLVPEKARQRALEFAIADVMTVEQLIGHPEVDLVLNLTIPNAHAEVSRMALEAGKHTYSEKPLAVNLEDGKDLVALADKKGVRLGAAPDTFLGGGLQTVRKLLDDGWIGKPVGATAFFMGHGPEAWHPSPHSFYKKGAGPLFDLGPYYITALIHLLGPVRRLSSATRITFPERIATSEAAYGERITVEVPTFVAGTLEFVSGAIATLVTSFDVWKSKLPRIELYGEHGTIAVPDPNTFGGPVEVFREGSEEWGNVPLSHSNSTNSRGVGVLDIASAISANRPHRASAEMSLHVLEVMHGLCEAAENGAYYELKTSCERPPLLPLGLVDGTIE